MTVPRTGDFLSVADRGHLLDLTPHPSAYGWQAGLLPQATRMATVSGKLLGVPRSGETMMLLHP